MNSYDPDHLGKPDTASRTYAMSGKIMLAALIILFLVIVTMLFLHFYTSVYLEARRRQLRRLRSRNRRSATTFIFFTDPSTNVTSRALDSNALKSLPVFSFSGSTDKDPTECAVCLSEFEENESCRVLPNCKHTFHVECIDMWFHSHSTCPLCRSNVEPITEEEQLVVEIPPPERVASVEPGSTSAASDGMKPEAIEVQINARLDSLASQSFRSPMSRVLSFTRMSSRERRITPSPITRAPPSSPMTESDVERGGEERR